MVRIKSALRVPDALAQHRLEDMSCVRFVARNQIDLDEERTATNRRDLRSYSHVQPPHTG